MPKRRSLLPPVGFFLLTKPTVVFISSTMSQARNNRSQEGKPPTISKSEGKKRFQVMVQKGRDLLGKRPLDQNVGKIWCNAVLGYIKETFGDPNLHTFSFIGQQQRRIGGHGYDGYAEEQDAQHMARRIQFLLQLIELIEMEEGFDSPAQPSENATLWSEMHSDLAGVSRDRFEQGFFADSVEAALKHINAKVKKIVWEKKAKELDGANLMRTAFSPNDPVIVLDDLSTESGRSIQQGYMEIFAGTMIGIRNPKAHDNVNIDSKRALHLLFLASLLLFKIDERK